MTLKKFHETNKKTNKKKFPPSISILYCQCQCVGNNATGNKRPITTQY